MHYNGLYMKLTGKAKIKCPRCNGDGYTSEHAQHPHNDGDCMGECPVMVQCEFCQTIGFFTEEKINKLYDRNIKIRNGNKKG